MEGESCVTRCIIDELLSLEIERDEVEVESGVTRTIIDELYSWDIQGNQMVGQRSVT